MRLPKTVNKKVNKFPFRTAATTESKRKRTTGRIFSRRIYFESSNFFLFLFKLTKVGSFPTTSKKMETGIETETETETKRRRFKSQTRQLFSKQKFFRIWNNLKDKYWKDDLYGVLTGGRNTVEGIAHFPSQLADEENRENLPLLPPPLATVQIETARK